MVDTNRYTDGNWLLSVDSVELQSATWNITHCRDTEVWNLQQIKKRQRHYCQPEKEELFGRSISLPWGKFATCLVCLHLYCNLVTFWRATSGNASLLCWRVSCLFSCSYMHNNADFQNQEILLNIHNLPWFFPRRCNFDRYESHFEYWILIFMFVSFCLLCSESNFCCI